jgi:hypothetical protein
MPLSGFVTEAMVKRVQKIKNRDSNYVSFIVLAAFFFQLIVNGYMAGAIHEFVMQVALAKRNEYMKQLKHATDVS